ncbi:subclass B3 metallo-beta-lactamase [Sphingomonas sp.]|jgi:metallo-beta-lactamase class B|uniref:subclass B3 metallo-beta-lactamase n=1 Tax=Sphingomonas sp. TaxID=28214 RepID=UPI002EDA4ACE
MKLAIAAALLAGSALPAAAQDTDWAQVRKEWNMPVAPFRITGNVHYVGTAGIAAYLITTPEGHILIDGAMEESAPLVAANIAALGFKLRDVKILLINHAHWDHSGGLAELKRLTGARLMASAGDKPGLEAGMLDYRPDLDRAPPVKVDVSLTDGEMLVLGGTTLITHLTPGHTKGCTSWTMRAGGLDIIFACSLSVAGQPLTAGQGYDAAAADFRTTFAKLKGMRADVFLNFHPSAFDMEAKRKKLLAGDVRAFVDPGELRRRVDAAKGAFEGELARQRH